MIRVKTRLVDLVAGYHDMPAVLDRPPRPEVPPRVDGPARLDSPARLDATVRDPDGTASQKSPHPT